MPPGQDLVIDNEGTWVPRDGGGVGKHRRHLGQSSRPPEQAFFLSLPSKSSSSGWTGGLLCHASPFLAKRRHLFSSSSCSSCIPRTPLYSQGRTHARTETHTHIYVHTYTRTLLATILLLPLLLHYPTLLLSCFNAIRRQLHSAWAPGAPELCRHPVRHPQVPATPHGRPHQPSATIPISCAPTLLGVFPVLNCGRTCCTCGRSAANIVSDDSNRIVNKKKVCLETHAPPVPLLTCCCYCEESRPP